MASIDLNQVPEFITKYVQEARQVVGVGGPEWSVTVTMTDKPAGDDSNSASCSPSSVYFNAHLEFSVYTDDGVKAREDAYHEVIHILHSEVDRAVLNIMESVPSFLREPLDRMYHDAVERMVQRLSRSLVANIRKSDEN